MVRGLSPQDLEIMRTFGGYLSFFQVIGVLDGVWVGS
jgi:hypothetical protein